MAIKRSLTHRIQIQPMKRIHDIIQQRWPIRSALLPVGRMMAAHDFQRIKLNFKTGHKPPAEDVLGFQP